MMEELDHCHVLNLFVYQEKNSPNPIMIKD